MRGLGNIIVSLPPLLEEVGIKAKEKRKREAEESAAAVRKKRCNKRKKKNQARLARARPGRSITLSTDIKDMTSTASDGVEHPLPVVTP